jgi:hypothetical protein
MNEKARLWMLSKALETEAVFAQRGYTLNCTADSIVIERAGHFRGIWTSTGDRYVWTAAGYSEPTFSTASLPEALRYMLTEISRV